MNYMNFNVILTFETPSKEYGTQEIFNLSIPVSHSEIDAVSFLNENLFETLVHIIDDLDRSVGDLIKISTAADWNLFTTVTNKTSLSASGHSCKWYFGLGRNDLDCWEKSLMSKFGFGTEVDMSYL